MLTELTDKQRDKMYEIRDKWINMNLIENDPIDKEKVTPYVEWLYSLLDEPAPEVVIVDSAMAAKVEAHYHRNPTDTRTGDLEVDSKNCAFEHFSCSLFEDSSWVAFYNFFEEIGILQNENFKKFREYLECGVCISILLPGKAILVNRPLKINREDDNTEGTHPRLHSLEEPAIEWRDGYKTYYVRGVQLQQDTFFLGERHKEQCLVANPELITTQRILTEGNAEVRKALMQIKGVNNFIKEAECKTIHEDLDPSNMPRRLMSVKVSNDETWCMVEVECPSKRDKHYLFVDPRFAEGPFFHEPEFTDEAEEDLVPYPQTCHAAVALTYNHSPSAYRPLVEA